MSPDDEEAQSSVLATDDRAILEHELDLIKILHHRNKNQHHGAHWYKYFKLLKSTLTRILALGCPNASVKLTKAEKAENARLEEAYLAQRQHFRDRYRSIFLAFTQIIGTGQYVALGMILLGILTRVWCLLKLPEAQMEDLVTGPVPSHSTYAGIVVGRAVEVVDVNDAATIEAGDFAKRKVNQVTGSIEDVVATQAQCLADASLPKIKRSKQSSSVKPRLEKRRDEKRKRQKTKVVDEIDSIFG